MHHEKSRLDLPTIPSSEREHPVAAWRQDVVIDTYELLTPDRYPAYLDRRVYQGSSGRSYPLPFFERITSTKTPHVWDAIHLENEYVRLMILPELGGRIHVGLDKTRDYDFFYRNNVIKPALVGLSGPWISGGVEFNWPQHHRPATYLPTDAVIEREADGAVTVWCSDHDPLTRMKGMHGIRMRPKSAVIEMRARLFNRTDDVQTFLWWANVAAAAGDDYQSFFPTDVHYVADHAKRAVVSFPRAKGPYYGVDYVARVDAEHPEADRLDWYKNIPVPTSYMCLGTEDDFFGGYDHGAQAGFVHWADHHISPGKKQWTWGNAPFGWAWDRNLTDTDGPYVELMAGVYTDNQPDFSFLAPGETKTFSQYWFPIQDIGPVHQATLDAAVRLVIEPTQDGAVTAIRVGLIVTTPRASVQMTLRDPSGAVVWDDVTDLAPGAPAIREFLIEGHWGPSDLTFSAHVGATELVRWRHRREPENVLLPDPAVEPTNPQDTETIEELYLTGVHLAQYRHATLSPVPYWLEALRRDPADSRTNVALAAHYYRDGRMDEAEALARAAIVRVTRRNPNPYDSEAFYRLGMVLNAQRRTPAAYDAFAKAAWSAQWRVPSWLAMARIDLAESRTNTALGLLDQLLSVEGEHLQARNLRVVALRRTGRAYDAERQVADTIALDPLDWWARDLAGQELETETQVCIDVALEYVSCGELDASLRVLDQATVQLMRRPVPGQSNGAPLVEYYRADILRAAGRLDDAALAARQARTVDATRCFPGRLSDALMLQRALEADAGDALAAGLLGHWLYAHERHLEAIESWERADQDDPVIARNLGVAAYNVLHDHAAATAHYAQALANSPDDAKLWFEQDQLAKRCGQTPGVRLARLSQRPDLVKQRDDLTVAFAELLVTGGQAERAVELLAAGAFQPWEGGEGLVLHAWEYAHSALAREALMLRDGAGAEHHAREALAPPRCLGEERHPLANCSDLHLMLGDALASQGRTEEARAEWQIAATFEGDFTQMSTTAFSDKTYFSAIAWRRLGREDTARQMLESLEHHAENLAHTAAKIDYFATSLPTLLLFDDDLTLRRKAASIALRAQAAAGLEQEMRANSLLDEVLSVDANHTTALDLRHELEARQGAPRS